MTSRERVALVILTQERCDAWLASAHFPEARGGGVIERRAATRENALYQLTAVLRQRVPEVRTV